MMKTQMIQLVALLASGAMGCTGSPATSKVVPFGEVTAPTGAVTMSNGAPDEAISGLIFENGGTSDIVVDRLEFVMTSGQVSDSGDSGFGVLAGGQAGALIAAVNHESQLEDVASISFSIQGTTEKLTVLTTTQVGAVP